jgi:hypothetical protein
VRTHGPIRPRVLDAQVSIENRRRRKTTFIGRVIMDKSTAKLAIVAVGMAAVMSGLLKVPCPGGRSAVAWAQAAPKVETAPGFIWQTKTTQMNAAWEESREYRTITYWCAKYGVRTDGHPDDPPTVTTYVNYDDGTQVILFHPVKWYAQRCLPPQPPGAEAERETDAWRKTTISQFMSGPYTKLGRQTMAGEEVDGIEVQNPVDLWGNLQIDSVTIQLWVSVKTGYPVLIQEDVIGNNGTLQIKTVKDQFEWDVQFDPNEFKAVIPPDYQLVYLDPQQGVVVPPSVDQKSQ